jgi:CDP-2,3-bis-(O-geranylgeranyl)-sn-glycerol synthase
MEFIQTIILPALYFFLPAYIANALPVVSKKLNILKFLAFPVDGGKKLAGKSLFGKSKTVRGFVVGVIGALIIAYLQYLLTAVSFFNEISLVEYSLKFSLLLGFLLGSGALLGDLIKSFIKRRIGIESGHPWIIADQIDYVVGALLLVSFVFVPSLNHIIFLLLFSPLLSFIANVIAYFTGIKKVWW